MRKLLESQGSNFDVDDEAYKTKPGSKVKEIFTEFFP